MVARPSLYATLERAVRHRLTVVSAGPGWGKTSTVAAWASQREGGDAVAWLSLDHEDDSPAAFWTAVLHALRRAGQTPDSHPVAALRPAATMSAQMLQATYQGLLALSSPIVLVLDDFHVIEDAAVLDSLDVLLQHDIPLHLVLISRTDVVLPLHRLRLAGDLTEIVAEDLAISRGEVAAFGAAAGFELGDADLDRILRRTDGWPAGIRLAFLHLSRPDADLSDFGGAERSVAEYLVAEVLDHQPPDARRFLIHTSVVPRVCADLADALVPGGHGQLRLETLEHANQFVTALRPEGQWYQYHPLLREVLEHLLSRDEPDELRAIHSRAAGWFAAHEEPVAALRHAALADDWALFANIFVDTAWPTILGKDRQVVERLLAAVPHDDVTPSAELVVCSCALSLMQGRLLAIPGQVDVARELLPSTRATIRTATAGVIEMLSCAAARGVSDSAAMQVTARAALGVTEHAERPFPALPSLRAVATTNLAVGLLWAGQTGRAGEMFAATAPSATEVGLELTALNAWAHLALCRLVEGRLDEAARVATRALETAAPRGVTSATQMRNAHLTVALVSLLRGRTDQADRYALSGLAATDGGVEPATSTALHLCQALAAVSRGRKRAAEQALRDAATGAETWAPPSFLTDWHTRATVETLLLEPTPARLADGIAQLRSIRAPTPTTQVSLARLLLASGDVRRANAHAREVCDDQVGDDGEVHHLARIEATLVRALVADHLGRDHEVVLHLDGALELAARERIWRPFLVGVPGRLLVALEHRSAPATQFPTRVAELFALPGPRSSEPEPAPLAEALTDRELAVLWALPTMQTNGEIARELFVSVNTVKSHLKSLYRKLDVSNRRDAIRRSRSLGLLS